MASDGVLNVILSEEEERKLIVEKYTKGREKILNQIDEWEDPKFELYHLTDRYGFIHKTHLSEKLTQYENKTRQHEAMRSAKWMKMINNWKSPSTKSKLRERVYKGIPDRVRGKVWMLLLDVDTVKKQQTGRYKEMLEWGLLHSTDVKQIDLDVNRTFRNNIIFKDRYNSKQQELFRILVAYSVYNTEIGYCQGMSQIAALLLMYMIEEEDAFWALDRLMSDDRYAMHGFFIPGFPKLTRFAHHHDLVLKKFLPKVYKHFKKFDIDSTLYTLKWFFQCFLDRVPFSLTLRLWDCFMLDGEVILTCMSYTLLKLHKKSVIRKGMEDLIEFLQVDLEKDFGFHDDEAIEALQHSVTELRRHKMDVPREPPSEFEKPTKPFGPNKELLDTRSISTVNDDQSVVGSIVLRPNGAEDSSLANTSQASSENEVGKISDFDDGHCMPDVSRDEMEVLKRSLESELKQSSSTSPSALLKTTGCRKESNNLSINDNRSSDDLELEEINHQIKNLIEKDDNQVVAGSHEEKWIESPVYAKDLPQVTTAQNNHPVRRSSSASSSPTLTEDIKGPEKDIPNHYSNSCHPPPKDSVPATKSSSSRSTYPKMGNKSRDDRNQKTQSSPVDMMVISSDGDSTEVMRSHHNHVSPSHKRSSGNRSSSPVLDTHKNGGRHVIQAEVTVSSNVCVSNSSSGNNSTFVNSASERVRIYVPFSSFESLSTTNSSSKTLLHQNNVSVASATGATHHNSKGVVNISSAVENSSSESSEHVAPLPTVDT